jgi:hypothetical protein
LAPRSLGFWLLWIGTCLAVAACFVLNYRLAAEREHAAASMHERAREEHAFLQEQLARRAAAVDALRGDVAAVDLSAREEYRLILPGERQELVEIRHLGATDNFNRP